MASKKCWIIGISSLVIAAAVATTITLLLIKDSNSETSSPSRVWGFKCFDNECKKVAIADNDDTTSIDVCRLTCSDDIGTLLPKPSKKIQITKMTTPINYFNMNYQVVNDHEYWKETWERFQKFQSKKLQIPAEELKMGKELIVNITVSNESLVLDYSTYEGYDLKVNEFSDQITVNINAENYYGARHALETLDQIIVFDEFNDGLVILQQADIEDEPRFKHRGISMDTSRNFFTVEDIERTIEGLAMVKMNIFHWHITDAHSMPLDLISRPELTKLGAYSFDKIYTANDIKRIVRFAKVRGIQVIPEFDTPGHVGEGWQNTGLTLCYKDPSMIAQWRGQFDVTKDVLYDYLEDIYREIIDAFQPTLFHMGGDEVNVTCWNSSALIRDWMVTEKGWELKIEDFMNLWSYFQEKAFERLDTLLDHKVPIIVWTSRLTEEPYLSNIFDKDRYIVQVWNYGSDPRLTSLLENGFNVIISNSDALYLDCGVGGWVNEGLTWCAPYKTWITVYNNRMEALAGEHIDQVFGAEAAIWSESIDPMTIDMRIWPRTSALAERLWTNSDDHWRVFEPRILWNNQRLSEIGGLAPERLQLEWCLQNEGDCPA